MLLGADASRAEDELSRSLSLEIRLAEISVPREQRRDATKFYHPRRLGDLKDLAPIVPDWTEYTNRLLTEDVMQASENYRQSIFCQIITGNGLSRNYMFLTQSLNSTFEYFVEPTIGLYRTRARLDSICTCS